MIITVLIFVAVLGVLIFVHEFGHFIAAKRSGLTVHEFGFGFPPRIIGIRRGSTLYSINWIPVGGFVKIKGESGPETGEPDSFVSLPAWRRTLILLAGVAMNFLLAAVIMSFAYAYGAPTALDGGLPAGANVRDQRIQILSVVKDTPAATSGLHVGDAILEVDKKQIATVEELQAYNAQHSGQVEQVRIRRGQKESLISVTPKVIGESKGDAVWGVNLMAVGTVSFPWYQALWLGLRQAFALLWQIIVSFAQLLKNLIVHQSVSADIAGPVGIAALTGQVVGLGFLYLLQFTALLSLNLALVNALPIPALDGGRVLFIIIEKIRGKKVNARIEAMIHNMGFALLLLLVLVVTIRDVNRLSGGLMHFFSSLVGKGGG